MTSSQKGFYSQPKYYDILFGWDRSEEYLFVDSIFQKHGLELGAQLLELACGTGSASLHLSVLGWEMTGLDISPEMVRAMEAKFKQSGRNCQVLQADMSTFRSSMSFDGAYCPLGSIGLLHRDEQLIQHFKSVAQALNPEGVYLIDLGLNIKATAPLDVMTIEWGMEKDDVVVEAVDGQVHIDDPQIGLQMSFPWEAVPLEFHWPHFLSLVEASQAFQVEAFYPEVEQREADGVSLFQADTEGVRPCERAMVVLRKA